MYVINVCVLLYSPNHLYRALPLNLAPAASWRRANIVGWLAIGEKDRAAAALVIK